MARWMRVLNLVRVEVPYEVIAYQERYSVREIRNLVQAAVAEGVEMPARKRYGGKKGERS